MSAAAVVLMVAAARSTDAPPVHLHTLLTAWQTDPLSLVAPAIDLAVAVAYLTGVRRLARRGRGWSSWRTASFLGGVALVAVAVNSGLASYHDSVIAMHVIQGMGIPVTTILGLVLRTNPTSIDAAIHTVADTHTGGSILWVLGALIMLTAMVVVVFQFMRADGREAARNDRRLAHEEANAAREAEWSAQRARVAHS